MKNGWREGTIGIPAGGGDAGHFNEGIQLTGARAPAFLFSKKSRKVLTFARFLVE